MLRFQSDFVFLTTVIHLSEIVIGYLLRVITKIIIHTKAG